MAFSLDAIEELGKKIAPEWHIHHNEVWYDEGVLDCVVEIMGPDGLWRGFHNPDREWVVLTDDGVPVESFNSLDDLEEAVSEGSLFEKGDPDQDPTLLDEKSKGTRYLLPKHPYIGLPVREVDMLSRNLALGWRLSTNKRSDDTESELVSVGIWRLNDLWYRFEDPDNQWIILTDHGGEPVDVFDSREEIEEAAKDLFAFCGGELGIKEIIKH